MTLYNNTLILETHILEIPSAFSKIITWIRVVKLYSKMMS